MSRAESLPDAVLIAAGDALATLPVLLGANSPGVDLLAKLGYRFPNGVDPGPLFADASIAAQALGSSVQAVVAAYADGSYKEASFGQKLLALAESIGRIYVTTQKLVQGAQALLAALPDYVADAGLDELPSRLEGYLLCSYLWQRHPLVASLGELIGFLRQTRILETEFNPEYTRCEIRWDAIGRLLTDPRALFSDEYQWGSPDFDSNLLFDRAKSALWMMGIRADAVQLSDPDARLTISELDLDIPIMSGYYQSEDGAIASYQVGTLVQRHVPTGSPADTGVALTPYVAGQAATRLPISEVWDIALDAALSLEGFQVLVLPSGVDLQSQVATTGSASMALTRSESAPPLVPLGRAGSTRIEIAGLSVTIAAKAQQATNGISADFGAEIALKGLALVIEAAELDGFLSKVLGALPPIALDLTVGFSRNRGVYLGSTGLDYSLQLNKTLGPLTVQSITLGLNADDGVIDFTVGASGGFVLGPIAATVDRIGLKARLDPAKPGSLGKADLALGFKPPNGIGLSINASVVKGGGFIALDFEKQQYTGVLQLAIQKTIDVKAIGILNARLPGGKPGFSLLVIITAEFPPIQLGMGFTLNGIGGLVGINRTAAVDVLRAGLRNGALDTMLFPRNPLGNVPALLSTLGSVFPLAEGRHVFGPMVRIGWGSPTILTLDVAVLIELPDPVRIILLGRLKAALPDEKKPVAVIRMDALGVLDFGRKELSLDATIYDSKILTFTLSGDMALRLSWGANPGFLLSVGGFHPHFQPPAGMPALGRMALVLVDFEKDGVTARVRLDSYFAITSNTVQFGAHVQAYVKVLSVEVQGLLGFDALVHFPFAIDAQMVAAVTLSFNGALLMGADVMLNLTGPGPWHLVGEARFVFLGVQARASIDFTSGTGSASAAELPPPADVAALLSTALQDARNWQPVLAEALPRVARVAPAAAGAAELLMHPLAGLAVRQRVAPLGVPLARYGNAPIVGGRSSFQLRLNLADAATSALREAFAMAQYQVLSDADKLARPSFEDADAGLQVQTSGFGFAADAVLVVPAALFEDRLVDPAAVPNELRRPATTRMAKLPKVQSQKVQAYLDTRGAAVLAPRTRSGKGRYSPVQA